MNLSPELRERLWRGSDLARTRLPGVPSGFAPLDAELPGGGWPVGVLTELLPAHEGIGELRLVGPALARLSREAGRLAWIAPPYLPDAPALAAARIDASRLIVVRTSSAKDALWAAEQALRSNACAAVLAWPESPRYEELRRLQIAAEGSNALALLFRAPSSAREASPAALRIAVSTRDGGLALKILKRRGAPHAGEVILPAESRLAVVRRRKELFSHAVDSRTPPRTAARKPAARLALS